MGGIILWLLGVSLIVIFGLGSLRYISGESGPVKASASASANIEISVSMTVLQCRPTSSLRRIGRDCET